MFTKILIIAVCINAIVARDRLKPNDCLKQNQSLDSKNGCFRLSMQPDGNLVVYRRKTDDPIWHSGTPRTCTNRACMQGDGNFVAYDCHNIATWNSGTPNNEGSSVVMQDDGNVVIYAWNSNRPIWSSNSIHGC